MSEKPSPLQISIDHYQNDQQDKFQMNPNKPSKVEPIHLRPQDQQSCQIVGMCQQFISMKELKERKLQLSQYQQVNNQHNYKWQPLACHFRNIQYTNQNVRTPKALAQCFQLICKQYLPYYREVFNEQQKRTKFQLFLYDRVKAIRCQFYVQNVFQPDIMLKIFKIILFLQTMTKRPIDISSLNTFFIKQVKQKLLDNQELRDIYFQALEYAIFSYNKKQLIQLLNSNMDQINQNPRCSSALQTKLKIINSSNYFVYLINLINHRNIFVRLLLWTQIHIIKQIVIAHYRKAKMNEKATFLCRVLGYKKMEGWINISKQEDWQKLQKNKQNYDLSIKLWITESQLKDALKNMEVQELKQNQINVLPS